MSDNRQSQQFAEAYINRCYCNNEAVRWWAHPLILVGGSICDRADFDHLAQSFEIGSVISVETEHDDEGKIAPGIPAFRFPFPDDGTPPPFEIWQSLASASSLVLSNPRTYVHCQQGGSRSPAVAYFIMRQRLGFSPDQALIGIRGFKTDYGAHPYHQSYLGSIENALKRLV